MFFPVIWRNIFEFQALKNNPKIEVVHGETYRFKPEFNMREKNGLRKLLDRHSSEGLGGVYMDAIEESLPNYQKHLKVISFDVLVSYSPSTFSWQG